MRILLIFTCTIILINLHLSCTNAIKWKKFFRWNNFKKFFKRKYNNLLEELKRKEIFNNELKELKKHQRLYDEGKVSFKREINEFSDISLDEFVKRYNGFQSDLAEPNTVTIQQRHATFRTRKKPPASIDWRNRGVNATVKDQAYCQACWAFAAAAALEAHELLYHGRDVELSEQNLIDCAESNYNRGCLGGHMIRAFNYTRKTKGISYRFYYPYEQKQVACRMKDEFNSAVWAEGYHRLPKGNETELQRTIAFVGPVTGAIYGNLLSLKQYSGGVFYDENCKSDQVNHAVLIVGYGTDEDGKDYWLIKNSMGTNWGEDGYLRLARNKNNHCGIASQVVYPIINKLPSRDLLPKVTKMAQHNNKSRNKNSL